ncbi:glycosyltransferase family 1 protein [Flavobacterium arcticum]|uniref:Glycosyltransferase family 1 protein n=1 Tax=Flavobacterium arcticum TaxID=1784713 RepID=A0A345HEC9_9FLAO|nr:glycosyltransferase [Flavobacterium arcticum]AXG74939.1 glycosyltransferase family 1 protein [Flavobacterium arcticum]KAF2506492.1 glycosyltransferase [Flavobacterium arcticum]
MKILLVGEYSRLHNSLKEGLIVLGHEVTIIGSGDDFKKYNVDHTIFPKYFKKNSIAQFVKKVTYRITGINLEMTEQGIRFYKLLPILKDYDHVQLINSDALETHPWLAKKLYKKLLEQNKKVSLLICGDDTPVMDYNLKNELKYSVLSPYLEDRKLKNLFQYSLKYTTNSYRKLFKWVEGHSNVLITSDLDYEIPMQRMGYTTHFIPNPINTDKIKHNQSNSKKKDKIIIFLGINRLSYIKKGINFFEEALEVIKDKYNDKVEIVVTENVPYAEYIQLYDRADILLDQVYGYDQGYNALEAMAKGKVVFTGAETEFIEHYTLTKPVAINALPNTQTIVKELSYLIENPTEITEISKRARIFIENEHNYIKIAQKYLDTWKKST